jgi:hypothetical protein
MELLLERSDEAWPYDGGDVVSPSPRNGHGLRNSEKLPPVSAQLSTHREHDAQIFGCPAMTFPRLNAVNCLIRSLAPCPRAASVPKRGLLRRQQPARPFSSSGISYKKLDFTQKVEQVPEVAPKEETQNHERNRSRKNAAKTSSLRRVAVEAQSARGFVKGKGNKRFVDPDVERKVSISKGVRGLTADEMRIDGYCILCC